MAYNNGRENRKWLIWKEAEEKILREHGVDETTTPQIRTDDRADFNSNRRFYHWTSDFGEYLEGMADRERNTEVKTVADLLNEIEDETLYRALVLVYKCGQEKLNNLYYQVKEQRRCSTWRKIKNLTLRNLNSRLWICIMPEEPRIHNWNVNMA